MKKEANDKKGVHEKTTERSISIRFLVVVCWSDFPLSVPVFPANHLNVAECGMEWVLHLIAKMKASSDCFLPL
jgi:hypothetical protein